MKKTLAVSGAMLLVLGLIGMVYADSATTSVTVGNAAPTVDSVTVDDASPSAGATTTVDISAQASDANGWDDISSIVCTVSGPGTVEDSPVTLSLSQLDGDTVSGSGSFDMDFHDAAGTYTVSCVATDSSSDTGSDSDTFVYSSLTALDLDASSVAFGGLGAGDTGNVNGDTDMGTTDHATIQNLGNTLLDVGMSGTDMTAAGNNTIAVGNVGYQFASEGFTALTTSAATYDLDLAAAALSVNKIDFQISVPVGTLPGSYSGTVDVVAA